VALQEAISGTAVNAVGAAVKRPLAVGSSAPAHTGYPSQCMSFPRSSRSVSLSPAGLSAGLFHEKRTKRNGDGSWRRLPRQ
jgi:hypothetical protein